MTQINFDELAKLQTLDQGILWAVISLTRSNKHPNNTWYSDNATIRQEVAKDLSNWNVSQDDQGRGHFSFTAIMPLLDPEPMRAAADICQTIKSYSNFALVDQTVDDPIDSKGFPMPELPDYVETLEQLLFYLVRIAEAVGRMIRYANAAARSPEPPTDPVYLDLTTAAPVLSGIVPIAYDTENSTGEAIIAEFGDSKPIYEGFSDWIQDIFDGLLQSNDGGIPGTDKVDTSGGYKPRGVETLPVCKEQDPTAVSFSENNLTEVLTRPKP
jgi:hypothetical protein